MRTLVGIAMAALALGVGLWWFAAATPSARGPHEEESAPAVPVTSPSAAAEPAPVLPGAPASAAEPAPETRSRREATSGKSDELARAQWVDGRVVLPEGTPPDEELFVVARGKDFADGSDHRAPVAPDGSFRVAFHEGARSGHLALEARYLYLERMAHWAAGSSVPLVLEPRLGARIAGRLVVPPGIDPSSVGGTLELATEVRTTTREVGRREVGAQPSFAFDALVPGQAGERTYDLRYDGELFVGEADELEPRAGQTLSVELPLCPGVALSGVVRASGRPLADAEVQAQSTRPSGRGRSRHARSDTDGGFRLGALPAGEIVLTVSAAGFAHLRRELGELAEGTLRKDLELVLGVGRTIAGFVRWPDGTPAEAEITLAAQGSTRDKLLDEHWVDCGEDGSFSLAGLSAEVYRVTASATRSAENGASSENAGSERWTVEIERVPAGTQDLVLTLTPGLALEGSVSDELGVPLAEFQLEAQHIEGDSLSLDFGEGLSESYRDSDGTFRLQGLTAGEWRIQASSPGHGPALESLRLPAQGLLRLVLPREAVVRGLVLDPERAPVAAARIVAQRVDEDRLGSFFTFDRDEGVLTDPEGRFEIDGLSPGPTILRASASGFAPSQALALELSAGTPVEGLELVLRVGGTILGEVLGADGGPVAGQAILAHGPDFDGRSETDEDGRFRFARAPPGEIDLWTGMEEGLQLHQRVLLTEGETVRMRFVAPTRIVRLHGRVRVAGEALREGTVFARPQLEGSAESQSAALGRTDADGSYELSLPGAGLYLLFLFQWGEASLDWCTTLAVPDVASFAFDVEIPLGRISGRVTDTLGTPLAGIAVASEPEQHEDDTHGSAEAFTDDEGRYELRVPAGRHAVTAGGKARWGEGRSDHARARVGGLVVSANGRVRDVDLRLARGGSLAGVVRRADGSPASEATLWGEIGSRLEALGSSEEGGRFELLGLAAGPLLLWAHDERGATREPMRVEITAGERQRVQIELAPATPVRLSVRQQGEPVGSEISVTDERGARHPVGDMVKGEARLGPLVAGRYTVRAQRDGKTVERAFEVTPGAPELVLELVFE